MHHERDEEHADGSTGHAEGDKARLDEVLGIVGGDDGAHHEANDGEREEILERGYRLGAGHVLEHEDEHLSHGPEHRKRNDGGTQRAVAPTEAQAAAGHGELNVVVFVLDLRHEEARYRTEDAHARQNPRNDDGFRKQEAHGLITDERFQVDEVYTHNDKPARSNHADNGENLQEGVSIAQVVDAEHLADNRILGRTVDRESGRKPDRKPESDSRAVAGNQNRLGNHERRHEQRGPGQNLILGEPVGKEPGGPYHKNVGREEKHLQHERLPYLASIRVGKRARENFLGIDEHTTLYEGHCENRQEIADRSFNFPHFCTFIKSGRKKRDVKSRNSRCFPQ